MKTTIKQTKRQSEQYKQKTEHEINISKPEKITKWKYTIEKNHTNQKKNKIIKKVAS